MTWLLVAGLTGLATTVGAVPFLFVKVSRRAYDTMLGLGAGLMLAAATLGLLATALGEVRTPAGVDGARFAVVLVGFLVGVGLLTLMDLFIPHEHAGGHHVHVHDDHVHGDDHAHHDHAHHDHAQRSTARKQGLMVVGAMALHRLPEGFAIGAAYATGGAGLGLTLAVAVAVQNAVEGAVMAAPLRRGGLRVPALVGIITATGLTVPMAAVIGYAAASQFEGAVRAMLSMAAGALLYLTCNEVIPESHSHGNEVRATFGILTGFVLVMIFQVLTGHRH